ncbi:MAG: anti-sigma F factor [Clostridiales bacterium]|nr:anti-sigma F factor [Clostridiales bacterium]
MSNTNSMKLIIEAKSQNESFARSVVAAFFVQINPTLEQVEDIKTAVSEAVTNCIVHGYDGAQSGVIEIECKLTDKTMTVTIRDFGKGIENVEQAMKPFYTTISTGERSGMGFTVMQAFCDNVAVHSQQGQTTVELTKKVV